MSWSKAVLRNTLLALALSGAATLAACTSFTPVYGERGAGIESQALRYDKPASRLDQIIYQELALKLGRSTNPSAQMVRVTTTSSQRNLTRSNVTRPSRQKEAVVSALIELISADGKVTMSVTRSASALYSTDRQALAESEAEREASERAALALADTVRLTLIAALANRT